MARVAIVVEFTLKADRHAAFDGLIREHARRTLEEEPGCERFDVLQPLGRDGAPDETRVVLCEVYRDQAAADEHGKSPRLVTVRHAHTSLMENRRLTLCAMCPNRRAPEAGGASSGWGGFSACLRSTVEMQTASFHD